MSGNWPPQSEFHYRRAGGIVRVQTRSLTNHEMRNVLIGLWLSLDEDDRVDHVAELRAYLQPGGRPPGMSVEIADAMRRARE